MKTDDLTPQAIERGRKVFCGECTFVAGVTALDNLIPMSLPEVAFAGRSNVGKSSLINAITGRKMLARTSHTPGRTQQLNFFNLSDALFIVDLPGYGYAKASKVKIKAWNRLIRQYLQGRQTLQRVCVLIDSRHGMKDVDTELMDMLDETAVTYMTVLTKVDKIKRQQLDAVRKEVETALAKRPAAFPTVFATSSAKDYGIAELRAALAEFA